MNKKAIVEQMLWDLVKIQDKITHLNENGVTWGLRKLKEKRQELVIKIADEACRD